MEQSKEMPAVGGKAKALNLCIALLPFSRFNIASLVVSGLVGHALGPTDEIAILVWITSYVGVGIERYELENGDVPQT